MTAQKNNELLPAYLIVGDDALKRATVVDRLRTRLAKLGDIAFNSDEFDGETALGGDIVSACNTVPFACEKRLVYVRNVEKLRKADSEELVAYLKDPCASTVLAVEAEKLAKSTRLYKALAAVGKASVIDCTLPKQRELPNQVRAMATTHGITFTPVAAAKLVELVGADTVRLDGEIRKIALAHRGGDAVNENEVIGLVARTTEISVWEFTDAFAARDLTKCLRYLAHMESSSPHALIARCVSRIRDLICAQSLMARGSIAALPKTIGIPEWKVKNFRVWTRQFAPAELRRALSTARDAERTMKTGADAQGAFVDWLIATLRR